MTSHLISKHPRLDGYIDRFESNVLPELESKEAERKIRLILGIVLFIVLLPVGFLTAWYFGFQTEDSDGRAVHAAYLIPSSGFLIVMWGFRQKIKLLLIRSITDHLGWNYIESLDFTRLIKRLNSFRLMPDYSHIDVGDILSGKHLDWPFQISEIKLKKAKGFGRNRKLESVFTGYVLTFNLADRSSVVTTLSSRITSLENDTESALKFKAEYAEVEGDVVVASLETESAQDALCSRFMSAIDEVALVTHKTITGCMIDHDHLHLIIDNQDMFELDWMIKSMEDYERVDKILSEFSEILHLLDIILKERECMETGVKAFPRFRRKELTETKRQTAKFFP